MRIPGRGVSNFTYYKICYSSCKAGKARNQLGKLRKFDFFKKAVCSCVKFLFFIFRTRQLQKSNFTRSPGKLQKLKLSSCKF